MTIAKVATNETFDLTLNGVLLGGFQKECSWEGLHKLRNEDGEFVIVDKDPATNSVLDVLRMSLDLFEQTRLVDVQPRTVEDLGKFVGVFVPTHTHIENCTDYQLLYVSNTRATKPSWGKQAVYTDGATVWSRPLSQFESRCSNKK